MKILIQSITTIFLLIILNSCAKKKPIPNEIIGQYVSVDNSDKKSYIVLNNRGEFQWIGNKADTLASGIFKAIETGSWNNGTKSWDIKLKVEKDIDSYGDIFRENASICLHDKHKFSPGEKDFYRFDLHGPLDSEWVKIK
jgi:hypothetical protein